MKLDNTLFPLEIWANENLISLAAANRLAKRQQATNVNYGDQLLVSRSEMDEALRFDIAQRKRKSIQLKEKSRQKRFNEKKLLKDAKLNALIVADYATKSKANSDSAVKAAQKTLDEQKAKEMAEKGKKKRKVVADEDSSDGDS